jgi:hypothetical protein
MHGFVSAHSPVDSKIVNKTWVATDTEFITETVSRADTWIRRCTQLLLTQKLSRKNVSLPAQKLSLKLFPKLMYGFVSAHNPIDSETVKEN